MRQLILSYFTSYPNISSEEWKAKLQNARLAMSIYFCRLLLLSQYKAVKYIFSFLLRLLFWYYQTTGKLEK